MFSNKSLIDKFSKLVLFAQIVALVLTIMIPLIKIPVGILINGIPTFVVD